MLRKSNPLKTHNYNKLLAALDKTSRISLTVSPAQHVPAYVPAYVPAQHDGDTDKDIYDLLKDISDKYHVCFDESTFLNCAREKQEQENEKKKEKEKKPHVVALVHIDEGLSTLADVLALIEKHPLSPELQYNINMEALHNIRVPLQELNSMIGLADLKSSIVDQILYFVQGLHKNNHGSGDFLHTVIYGPPGTGKTEIAKIMGSLYSKLGILSKGTFKKVCRSDLIAGYLGQTALKTADVVKEALGGVLFIDEAYALGNSEKKDAFAKECIDTLCEALSDNKDNLMVIIAGYETELNDCFFNYNQGLNSRFTWRFKVNHYTADDLHKIWLKKVADIGWEWLAADWDASSLFFKKNVDFFACFGRDVETLLTKTKIAHSKRVFCKSACEKKKLCIADLEKGFEMFLKNDDSVKARKDAEYARKQLQHSLYS